MPRWVGWALMALGMFYAAWGVMGTATELVGAYVQLAEDPLADGAGDDMAGLGGERGVRARRWLGMGAVSVVFLAAGYWVLFRAGVRRGRA